MLSAIRLKPLALKGHAQHRLTWRRLCLPCQASAIYEFDLNQDLWWHSLLNKAQLPEALSHLSDLALADWTPFADP